MNPTINPVDDRKSRFQADAILLIVAIIWGSAFVVQRVVAPEVGVFLFNGLRFLLAALILLPFAWISHQKNNISRLTISDWKILVLLGVLLLAGAAFQQAGLKYTTAANAGFITGLYVIFIPFISVLLFRQRIGWTIWLAALISVIGLYLLSVQGQYSVNPGDFLELAGAFIWAFHVIIIGIAVQRMGVFQIAIGQYVVCGVISILVGLIFEPIPIDILRNSMWAVLYTAILSVALGYTFQVYAQRKAPPADTAIIMSAEAVFAALFGWIFLSEYLTGIQIVGCLIIFAGIILVQVAQLWKYA